MDTTADGSDPNEHFSEYDKQGMDCAGNGSGLCLLEVIHNSGG